MELARSPNEGSPCFIARATKPRIDRTGDKCLRRLGLAAARSICRRLGRCSRQTLSLCWRVRLVDRPLRAMGRVRVQELHGHAPIPRAAEHLLEYPLQLT